MNKQLVDISEERIDNCRPRVPLQIGTKVMPRTRCHCCLMGLPLACSYICVCMRLWTWTVRVNVYAHTHMRERRSHTWRDRTYMRHTYDLPESALRSTSEYITAAFVALIPIADERMRVSGAPPGYFCAVGTSPKRSSRWLSRCFACDRCFRLSRKLPLRVKI